MAVKNNLKKTPGRPKSAPEETRAKLLEAATELFATHGLGATSLAKVAAAAGVTSAMVHYYFHSKEELVKAVVVERLGRFLYTVVGDGDFDPDEPLEYALAVIPRLAEAVEVNPWLPGLWVREVISDRGGLREYMFELLPKDLFGRLSESFSEGVKSGKYSSEAEPGLLLFTAITNYLLPLAAKGIVERLPGLGQLTPDRLVRHAQAVLRHGYSGPPASGARPERSRS